METAIAKIIQAWTQSGGAFPFFSRSLRLLFSRGRASDKLPRFSPEHAS